MVWLLFSGWFQCRLATDPDPADEPRGVSGYAHAVAGEPDLDRVVRLQPAGAFQRSHCPPVGVSVHQVVESGTAVPSHPLIGAAIDLLELPRFEGRNGIVAEDGLEPIVPFVFSVEHGNFRLERRHANDEIFPFAELKAQGVQPGLSAVASETGIYSLADEWTTRGDLLRRDLDASQDPTERAALQKRLDVMANRGLARFFGVRMLYGFALGGDGRVEDPDGCLGGPTDLDREWPIDFWLGGWDADAFCGYMKGGIGLAMHEEARAEDAMIEGLGEPTAPLRA